MQKSHFLLLKKLENTASAQLCVIGYPTAELEHLGLAVLQCSLKLCFQAKFILKNKNLAP